MEVIRDDLSSAGLRRVHLMDGCEIPLEEGTDRLGEGWELVEFASYEDDLDFWHLHVYGRRQGMTTMQVYATFNGDHAGAMRQAAGAYERKFGRLPNTAYVHTGVGGAEVVELRGADGEALGQMAVRRVGWMLPSHVGVCVEVDDERGG